MRTLTNTVKAALNSDFIESKDIVIITIPASVVPPLSQTVLYFANGEGITVDGQLYENKLREISGIKFSLSSAPDGAEVAIENVSRDLGTVLTDTTRVLDGSSAVIKRIFKVADGSWEAVTLFVGYIKDIKVDQETINLALVSDMNKRGTKVAGRTVTQRCIFVFNKNGSGVGPLCGWLTSQPGDPNSCDHDLDSANGCKAHGNQHRFGGLPAFTTTEAGNGYDSNGGGGFGGGSGGGFCVHPDSWILTSHPTGADIWIKAYNIKAGEKLVTIDKFGRLQKTKVIEAEKGVTDTLFTLITRKGFGITCSPSHPFIKNVLDDTGTPAHLLKLGDKVLVYENSLIFQDEIDSIEEVKTTSNVILFKLEEPYHLYVGGNNKKGGIWFHNLKPHYVDNGGIFGIRQYEPVAYQNL